LLVFAVLMDRAGLTAASWADLAHVAAAQPVGSLRLAEAREPTDTVRTGCGRLGG